MNTAETVAAVREMLAVALLLVSPFLGVAVLASLVIGLLQASTRMNDLTLSFVPRFLAVLLAVYLAGSWASAQMAAYIERSASAAHLLFR